MEIDELFKQLEDFLHNETACQKTLGCLNSKAQLGLVIGGQMHLCIQWKNGGVDIQKADCPAADFIFYASPDSVATMIDEKGLTPGGLGVKLVKQVLTHDMDLTMPGHFFQVMRKGYLDIIKVGGMEFLMGLREHNLASVFKILAFIKGLRKTRDPQNIQPSEPTGNLPSQASGSQAN